MRRVDAVRSLGPIGLLALFLSAPALTAQAFISVSDLDSHGTLGDSELSLDEAIQLSNGDISLSQLSSAEQSFVSGTPGAGVADTIGFSFTAFPGTINLSQTLTTLHAGLDLVDGSSAGQYQLGQILLDGGNTQPGFSVTGSNTTIFQLEITRTSGPVIEVSAPGGGACTNVQIKDCLLRNSTIGLQVVGAFGGSGTVGTSAQPVLVSGTTIRDMTVQPAAGVVVDGGTSDNNKLYVKFLDSVISKPTAVALQVDGGTSDGVNHGDNNDVTVELVDTSVELSFQGAGVIATGGNTGNGNDVDLVLRHATVRAFKKDGIKLAPGSGNSHTVELVAVLSLFSANTESGVLLQGGGDSTGSTLSARLLGSVIQSSGQNGVLLSTSAAGAGTGQLLSFRSDSSTYLSNKRGWFVSADNTNAHTIDLDASDSFIEGSTTEGLRVKAAGAATTYRMKVERNAFRSNLGGGVVVASGAGGVFDLDLGGGPLASDGGNTFEGNTGCGIDNKSIQYLYALDNDWGSASGPSDCNASDGDGITDPTGSGDGCGEYCHFDPFVAYDQNPRLTVTGSLDPPSDITITVSDGVTGAPFFLFDSPFLLNPPRDTRLGNNWYLGAPVFLVITGFVGSPIGPFPPPGGIPPGIEVYMAAAVGQGHGELTNFAAIR